MSDIDPTVAGVRRLLHQAGVDRPPPRNRRPRGRLARVRRWILFRLLVLLACLAVALGSLVNWSTGTATDPIFPPTDLQSAPHHPAVDPRLGVVEAFRAPKQAALLPIGWERIPFEWRELQKTGADSWDAFATDHDKEITQELKASRTIVGLLINTPDWAASQPSLHGASPPKGLYLAYDNPGNVWGHFVGLIAKRYAGRIDDWIVWNEVNIPSGHWKTWGGTHADYAQMVKVAYLAAKQANPHARIVLAGDPYWYDHGAFFTDLLRRLAADPGARANHEYFDVVNLHLYSRPADMVTVVGWYRKALQAAGVAKPIWISETNAIPYDDTVRLYARGGFRASLDDQASFMIQALALDLALGVQRIEVNRMIDGADFRAGGEPFGLVRNDGTVRPAFYAYRTAATLYSGVTGGSIQVNAATGVYTVTLRRPGATIRVLWDQHPKASIVSIRAGASSKIYDKFGQQLRLPRRAGSISLHLAGATGNTNSADAKDYVIGGNPAIVVEPS